MDEIVHFERKGLDIPFLDDFDQLFLDADRIGGMMLEQTLIVVASVIGRLQNAWIG